MKGSKYNSNDSLFSLDYKISYQRSSIEEHLEQSQEEINFIKVKLTEAYEKLEFEIKTNTHLEEENQEMARRIKQIQEKYMYEKKENCKLKETLQLILKNRKLLQEEVQQNKENINKKIAEKQNIIDELQRQNKALINKTQIISSELQTKMRLIKDLQDKFREDSLYKDQQNSRQIALANRIHILEQQIGRITEQKYIQVNRLRHQLQLYQRNVNSFPSRQVRQIKIEERKQDSRVQRKRDFSSRPQPKKILQKYQTKQSVQSDFQFNKQNVNSPQINSLNSLTQSSISKWKRPSTKDSQPDISINAPITVSLSEDQQLTQYQLAKKKAEQELCALEKNKRPSNEERQKISRLQRQIYHLDSDIAGLKSKIRRKY